MQPCAQSCLTLCDPWTVACLAPLSMASPMQGYQSRLPFLTLGGLPNPGIETSYPASPALSCRFFTSTPQLLSMCCMLGDIYICMLSCFSHVQLCAILWTIVCQDPLSMGFFRQEYWSGLWYLTPGYICICTYTYIYIHIYVYV